MTVMEIHWSKGSFLFSNKKKKTCTKKSSDYIQRGALECLELEGKSDGLWSLVSWFCTHWQYCSFIHRTNRSVHLKLCPGHLPTTQTNLHRQSIGQMVKWLTKGEMSLYSVQFPSEQSHERDFPLLFSVHLCWHASTVGTFSFSSYCPQWDILWLSGWLLTRLLSFFWEHDTTWSSFLSWVLPLFIVSLWLNLLL